MEPTVNATDTQTQDTVAQNSVAEEVKPTLVGSDDIFDDDSSDDTEKDGDSSGEDIAKEDGDSNEKVVPDNYEVKLPEGMSLDKASLDLFTPIFKELGLDNDGVQKLIDAYIPMINNTAESTRKESYDSFNKMIDEWKNETLKELGANADKELAFCAKSIRKFGSKDFKQLLDETGMGNNKHVVKFLINVGKTISEDQLVDTAGNEIRGSGGVNLDIMYPSMKQ